MTNRYYPWTPAQKGRLIMPGHATETMAERAWRYGLESLPCQTYCQGWLFTASVFRDNSAILWAPFSGDPLFVIHDLSLLYYLEP